MRRFARARFAVVRFGLLIFFSRLLRRVDLFVEVAEQRRFLPHLSFQVCGVHPNR